MTDHEEPTAITVPDDVGKALTTAGLRHAFNVLPPSHRDQYLRMVETEEPGTNRVSRIGRMISELGARARTESRHV